MAAVCDLCGKGPSWGMSVSHSHRRTKRRWNPNIQRVRALVDGTPRRLYVYLLHQGRQGRQAHPDRPRRLSERDGPIPCKVSSRATTRSPGVAC